MTRLNGPAKYFRPGRRIDYPFAAPVAPSRSRNASDQSLFCARKTTPLLAIRFRVDAHYSVFILGDLCYGPVVNLKRWQI